jgi:probable FeS assembly SUF system protein SufT
MESIKLRRDCDAISIPKGLRQKLAKGTSVDIIQERSGSYTVSTPARAMYRIEAKDAEALGFGASSLAGEDDPTEQLVWKTLRSVRDPELPVNIVDLGLIYSCTISPAPAGHAIAVRMTMTSPGCSMSDVLKSEVEKKLLQLPGVTEARVEVVFDPPWSPDQMSEEARLQIGLELGEKKDLIQISPNRS